MQIHVHLVIFVQTLQLKFNVLLVRIVLLELLQQFHVQLVLIVQLLACHTRVIAQLDLIAQYLQLQQYVQLDHFVQLIAQYLVYQPLLIQLYLIMQL